LQHSRETVLKQDLSILREAIDKYYADLNKYPEKLPDLVDKHYVRSVPVDPFTRLADTWTVVASDDPDHPGIRDIQSGAPDIASNGTPVSSW
jgi:general secretion pathway protein G